MAQGIVPVGPHLLGHGPPEEVLPPGTGAETQGGPPEDGEKDLPLSGVIIYFNKKLLSLTG